DLAIALGVLAASRQIPDRRLGERCVLGELSLDGRVRSVRGVLAVALGAASRGRGALLVPRDNAAEARAVPDLDVLAVRDLAEAILWAKGRDPEPIHDSVPSLPDCDDPNPLGSIRGQESAKRALTIAAAGGHGVLF